MHTTTPTETPQEIRVTGHMPVLAGLLLTSLLLGLTWRHWMEENKASHNRRQAAGYTLDAQHPGCDRSRRDYGCR